jgi:hypothetical protein
VKSANKYEEVAVKEIDVSYILARTDADEGPNTAQYQNFVQNIVLTDRPEATNE